MRSITQRSLLSAMVLVFMALFGFVSGGVVAGLTASEVVAECANDQCDPQMGKDGCDDGNPDTYCDFQGDDCSTRPCGPD